MFLTDLLMRDQESKKEIDSMTTACLDQLKLIQEKHGENITSIRNQAEKSLTKDYLVRVCWIFDNRKEFIFQNLTLLAP